MFTPRELLSVFLFEIPERTAEIEDELGRIRRDLDADSSVGSQSAPRRDEDAETDTEQDDETDGDAS
ncbi:hypothetical protein OB919_00925 [Halobacteria archaeon AArc-curdl1]|uniref:Uncharacterized protein n=1 Tax=Natronosalvus hydrolyticus TaxID=2979988 RepID=A0AAP3E4K7_9EURY|nr:hypothetical protein [Halobacteria archaeon AArc-curdl1]